MIRDAPIIGPFTIVVKQFLGSASDRQKPKDWSVCLIAFRWRLARRALREGTALSGGFNQDIEASAESLRGDVLLLVW